MNNKSRREEFFSDAARDEEVTVIVNSNQNNQNTDRSISRSRFETSESESSFRAITQSSSENQVNSFNCYNCEKSVHFFLNYRQFKKINFNNFVREMNVHDKNDTLNENFKSELRKE